MMLRALFLLTLGYALFPYFFVIEPLFLLGTAKVYPCDFVFVMSFVAGGYKALSINKFHLMRPLRKCLIALVAYGVITSLRGFSSFGYSAFGDHARWSYYLVLFGLSVSVLTVDIKKWTSVCEWFIYIGIACAVSSLLNLALYLLGIDTNYDEWVRFSNAVSSLFMVFSLLAILGRYLINGKWSSMAVIQFAVVLGGLIVGQARTAWVCGFVGVIVLFALNWRKVRFLLKPMIGFSLAGLIVLTVFSSMPNSTVADNLNRSANFLSGLENDPDWIWRLVIWEQVLDQSMSSPIFGKAFGTPFEFQAPDAFYENLPPHNGWLALLYHQGLIGVLLNFSGFLLTFVALRRLRKHTALENMQVAFSVLFAQEVAQFVYFIPYGSTLVLWVVPGLALSAEIRDRQIANASSGRLPAPQSGEMN